MRVFFLLLLSVWTGLAQATVDIQHWQTERGLSVYFYPAPELPMMDARLVFRGGSAYEGEQYGLAMLTAAMLDQGAGDWSADALAEHFSSVGAQFGTDSLRDMAYVSLRSLTQPEVLEAALLGMETVLSSPHFGDEDFQRLRQQALVGVKRRQQNPANIASEAFYRALYGDHPYAHSDSGTEDSLQALTTDDLRSHFQRYYVNRNAVLALVGDLSREQAEAIAQRLSAAIPIGKRAADLPEVTPLEEAQTLRIPFPSTQAHVYIGQPGMRRGDPDYYALYKGNHVLGGSGFSSRLFDEVRVKRGYSYSVYSYFLPMMERGPFMIGLQTRVDQVDDALDVAMDTVQQFMQEGPTRDEFQHAEKNIVGGYPLRIASNANLVEYLSLIGYYDLPLDYLDQFQHRIKDVSVDDIRDAFARRVHPERMITVVVGGEAGAD